MLIGLNGQIGVGKDTLFERALYVCTNSYEFPYTPERVAFADAVKLAAAELLEVDAPLLDRFKRNSSYSVRFSGPRFSFTSRTGLQWVNSLPGMTQTISSSSVRRVLQRLGAEVGRAQFGEDFWIDRCLPMSLNHDARLIVVTDCRYPNEAQRIHDLGGVIVRVTRGSETPSDHSSERLLPNEYIDFFLDNDVSDDDFASLDETIVTLLRSCLASDLPRRVGV